MITHSASLISSLACGQLPELEFFTSAAQAEKFCDWIACRLGLPQRGGAVWVPNRERSEVSRQVEYRNAADHLHLTVLISKAGTIEGKVRYSFTACIERTDQRVEMETPTCLHPRKFEKHLRERLARARAWRAESQALLSVKARL